MLAKNKDLNSEMDKKYKEELKNDEDEKYVVLMETSGEEFESWYYFIRYRGNEKNLQYLQDQLETINWYILDDLSTFDLDLEHFVSEKTAKEFTKLELNHYSFHRKFDGVLQKIEFNLDKKEENNKKMIKVFDKLGYGQIDEYIDDEDIDDEDIESDWSDSSTNEDLSDSLNEKSKIILPESLRKNNIPKFM